jgi:CheY-like chemotaxis protein
MDNKNLSLSGLKVLVVDDEEDALALTQLMLELCDAEVITSPTAAEGLEQVQMQRPNVIISDIRMPHMDGYQFIQAVRKLPLHKGKCTPAVAFTTFTRAQDQARAFDVGFQGYLSKLVSFDVLIETIMAL